MQGKQDLSAEAQLAYRAFQDMSTSKDQHFRRLESISVKYENGGAPSDAEKLELQELLAAHNRNVIAFKTAMSGVKDADEKGKLVRMMS